MDFEDITAIIGVNDAGKSALLEALDIFMNDGVIDKHDASINGNPEDVAIICEFEDLPEEIVIDDASPTSLEKEFLLNADKRLEIHKIFNGSLATPKCSAIYVYAIHPSAENVSDLLQLKNGDLKKRAQDMNVDLTDIDVRMSASIRAKIRESVKDLDLHPTSIPLLSDNAKKVWDALKLSLPVCALFKSDRVSTDQDSEAQDPLKIAIKEALREKEDELKEIKDYVTSEVSKIAQLTLAKIQEMDPNLASELKPVISQANAAGIFKASITGDEDIPINKRGSGVRRLILLNFFRAKAEQGKNDSTDIIYCIEEPETSQHPNNQRLLLHSLNELSEQNQIIMSTHTPMLARGLQDECLRYIKVNPDKTRTIMVGGETTNAEFSKTLGVLPDNSVEVFIGVEGKHDVTYLCSLAKKLIADGQPVPNLEKMEIDGELIFFILGGSNLALWTNRLEGLNRPEFHLYDRDASPAEDPIHQKEVDIVNCRDNCKAVSTGKRELENYLHYEAINEAYAENGIDLRLTDNFDDDDDVPCEVAKLVYTLSGEAIPWEDLGKEKMDKKMSRAKRILNGKAALLMNAERLTSVDPDNEVISWLNEIKELLKHNNQAVGG